ncbi:MAG: hypothetical protein AMJ72_02735 [Acidithiobacillales bacterium SM1_46]|nr:MAG: hypothetical protein AMJ72_02735 [Acidithiobacillales bacterium SM1_46]
MSFNGSGTFNINTTGQPVVSGTIISSSAFNALTADLANGLSTCITKDGQTTITSNIPMANYKITGLGTATVDGDALSYGNTATISTLTLTDALSAANGGTGLTSTGANGNVLMASGGAWVSSPIPSGGIVYALIFGL